MKRPAYRISRSEFYEWLFGLVNISGLFRNARQELAIVGTVMLTQKGLNGVGAFTVNG